MLNSEIYPVPVYLPSISIVIILLQVISSLPELYTWHPALSSWLLFLFFLELTPVKFTPSPKTSPKPFLLRSLTSYIQSNPVVNPQYPLPQLNNLKSLQISSHGTGHSLVSSTLILLHLTDFQVIENIQGLSPLTSSLYTFTPLVITSSLTALNNIYILMTLKFVSLP